MKELLQHLAPGKAVSGQALAEHLGVTRAAIWKQIESLRAMGVPVTAQAGLGYRLPWPVELLSEKQIKALLSPSEIPVHVHWKLDSTQDELARMALTVPDLTTVLCEYQSAGRGRRGCDWHSAPGMGIALSCLKRFKQGPAALSGLSIAMGVSTVKALEALRLADQIQIKWPNDLISPNGKIAGLLIELDGEYDGPCTARVGLGLNLRLTSIASDRLPQPASDLASLASDEKMPHRNCLAAELVKNLRTGLLRFERKGLAPFAHDFKRLDALAGKEITVHTPRKDQPGIGCGIDQDGALLVRIEQGRVIRVLSDKVSFRS